uniref:60S ribosomal export protein NMD3 n=1 Tax=Gongylonema pulchrum TaxID=637853 RepID=A0A183D538_9BILA
LQELVTHDTKNNTYDYKHTFCVEVVPICRDCVVCLPKRTAQSLGNMNQLLVCVRVNNVVTLIDPATLQIADVNSTQYYRDPFHAVFQSKQLVEFYVLDVEDVGNLKRASGHGRISTKHRLVDVWVVPSDQVGHDDQQICTRSHLGHVLKPGDLVLGYHVRNINANSALLDEMKPDEVPDVILVRKIYDRTMRQRRRNWKLKRLVENGNVVNDTASVENEFEVGNDPSFRAF